MARKTNGQMIEMIYTELQNLREENSKAHDDLYRKLDKINKCLAGIKVSQENLRVRVKDLETDRENTRKILIGVIVGAIMMILSTLKSILG